MKIKRVDATEGSLVRRIFVYTVPLILTTLVQQLFNAVDIAANGIGALFFFKRFQKGHYKMI